MPPIRRYLRISPHSCLEVRIFVDNPADISTWLLRPSNPALPRVFKAVKPLILPKLREENERTRLAKGKGGKKKKAVKDVVKGDDFEVVIFLTEGQGRHEVVIKRKEAQDRGSKKHSDATDEPIVIREEDDEDEDVSISEIPSADEVEDTGQVTTKIGRPRTSTDEADLSSGNPYQDEKKSLKLNTRYDGFSIWGKILCLLVERKIPPGRGKNTGHDSRLRTVSDNNTAEGDGPQQLLMQEWISSTQLPQDDDDD